MKLVFSSVAPRRGVKNEAAGVLAQQYVSRCGKFWPTEVNLYDTEAALLASAASQPGRSNAALLLFDSRGEDLTSEQFALVVGRLRDEAAQRILFAVGPADGWSQAALSRARRVLSLGRMTLPHELARVVVAEQVYRALTILAGHPYHTGH